LLTLYRGKEALTEVVHRSIAVPSEVEVEGSAVPVICASRCRTSSSMDFQLSYLLRLLSLLLRHQGLDLHALQGVGDARQGIVVVVVVDNHRCFALIIVPFKLLFLSLVAGLCSLFWSRLVEVWVVVTLLVPAPFLQLWGLA